MGGIFFFIPFIVVAVAFVMPHNSRAINTTFFFAVVVAAAVDLIYL